MSTENVKTYFNTVSSNYQKKNYGRRNKFLHYFFSQRLFKCTKNVDFTEKIVLDVGAGTGALYNYLSQNFKNVDYYATDISSGMMESSNIPQKKQFIGDVYNNSFDLIKVDLVYLLGVITYIPEMELGKVLDYIESISSKQTQVILTINHKNSIHKFTHDIIHPLMRFLKIKNKVIGQSFKVHYYKLEYFESLMTERGFKLIKIDSLNQSIYPLNLLFPKLFSRLGYYLDSVLNEGRFKQFISSDLALRFRKQ